MSVPFIDFQDVQVKKLFNKYSQNSNTMSIVSKRKRDLKDFVDRANKKVKNGMVLSVQKWPKPQVSVPSVPGFTRTGGYYGRFSGSGSGSEMKFYDSTLTLTMSSTAVCTVTAGTNITGGLVENIAQGTTQSTRIGRKINVKSIQIKGVTAPSVLNTTTQNVCVIYLIWDKQCNGAYPAVTDIFDSASSFPVARINMANSERFVILKKFYLNPTLAGQGTTAGTNYLYNSKSIDYFRRCDIPIEYATKLVQLQISVLIIYY